MNHHIKLKESQLLHFSEIYADKMSIQKLSLL